MEFVKVVDVIEDKCLNCHQCISVCPSKFANNGSGDVVHVNHALCIGCGQCVKACSHKARIIVDDFDIAFNAINNEEKLIAIVAPAIVASFPDSYLQVNGWLKSLGVKAIFDVSFGAELTVKSYLHHIETNKPKTVIAQPCPAIVSYVQLYHSELIQYLAPVHSPMMHTIAMIKEFYPKYKNHKILIISPCVAKKREMNETRLGDYNLTFASIESYLEKEQIDLKTFDAIDFDSATAERATLFSTPGGLLATAERELPGIRNSVRKIEGPELVYNYLDKYSHALDKGMQPLIVDCLNCDSGCNGGTGTNKAEVSQDELEYYVNTRAQKHIEKYGKQKEDNGLSKTLDKYWKTGLYDRDYQDYKPVFLNQIKEPTAAELQNLFATMNKVSDVDIVNCASCGYNTCAEMAKAIHNGLNRKENCFYYNQKEVEKQNAALDIKIAENIKEIKKQDDTILQHKNEIINQSEQLLSFLSEIKHLIN